MRMTNRIVLCGRVGRDPELRQSQSGTPWAMFTLATDRARRDGEGWASETDWHTVKVFGREAEYAQRLMPKGALVWVEGSLQYEKYTAQDGSKRTVSRILADRVALLHTPRVQGAQAAADAGAETLESGEPAPEPFVMQEAAEAK